MPLKLWTNYATAFKKHNYVQMSSRHVFVLDLCKASQEYITALALLIPYFWNTYFWNTLLNFFNLIFYNNINF